MNATVTIASTNPNDTTFRFYANQTGQQDLCVMQVQTKGAANSTNPVNFGMMLPSAAKCNNRLLTYGNGGIVGCIYWVEMVAGAWDGFAVLGTDTGHSAADSNGTFAMDQDKALDWGYRAINVSLPLAQALVKAYYQLPGSRVRSYYTGCSTGGRQGLRELMQDPTSFDGMLIGAPSWDFNRLEARGTQVASYNDQVSKENRLETDAQMELVIKQVLAKCDMVGFDMVKDNIVMDVDACNATMRNDTNWEDVSCEKINNNKPGPQCLTLTQREIARNMTTDGYLNGRLVYEGFTFPSARGWTNFMGPAATGPNGADLVYVKNFFGEDHGQQNWTWAKNAQQILNDSESDAQHRLNGARVDDFASIGRSSAKIILYHGLADGVIPVKGSRRLFDNLQNKQNVRYFEIPGMEHCGNGPNEAVVTPGNPARGLRAPWYIGGVDLPDAVFHKPYNITDFRYTMPVEAKLNNTNNDALLALVQWAEGGSAPSQLVATAFTNQTSTKNDWFTIFRQQLLCPYPSRPNGNSCT